MRKFLFCDTEYGRHAWICSAYSLLMLWCAPATSIDIGPASAQTVVEYKLTDRQLACLRDNAEAYRMAKRDPLFIPLNQCPKLPENPILESLLAEGPSSIMVTENTSDGDTFIYVTKAQFECLIDARPAGSAKLYRFLPTACRLEPLEPVR